MPSMSTSQKHEGGGQHAHPCYDPLDSHTYRYIDTNDISVYGSMTMRLFKKTLSVGLVGFLVKNIELIVVNLDYQLKLISVNLIRSLLLFLQRRLLRFLQLRPIL